MDEISDFLDGIKPRRDGDIADRFNYCYTVIILLVFAGFIAGWEFVGNPIQCWFPAEFTDYWEEYTEYYCFVKNTYFVPFTHDGVPPKNYDDMLQNYKLFPSNRDERKSKEIPYYQWVPFILAIMGLLFYMPIMAWRGLNSRVAPNVNGVLGTAVESKNICQENRQHSMQVVAGFVHYSNEIENSFSDNKLVRWFFSSHVAILYLMLKLLYCVISIGQLYMLNNFLAIKSYNLWGPELFADLLNGREWGESGRFPRVTFCDFEVYDLGETLEYSVQCVLLINEFNEKIFLFVWFWLFFISAVNILSLIYWFTATFSYKISYEYVRKTLQQMDPEIDHPDVQRFVQKELRSNGLLVMQLVSVNAGDIVAAEMLKWLYRLYAAPRLMKISQRAGALPLAALPGALLHMKIKKPKPKRMRSLVMNKPSIPDPPAERSSESDDSTSKARFAPHIEVSMSSLNDEVDDKMRRKRSGIMRRLKRR